MRKVTRAEIPQEAEMMNDLWELIKEFYIHEPTDEYWEQLIRRTGEIDRRRNSRLGQKLMLAFCDYIEEQQKAERRAGVA